MSPRIGEVGRVHVGGIHVVVVTHAAVLTTLSVEDHRHWEGSVSVSKVLVSTGVYVDESVRLLR